jgi:4-hydroxy-tetrahydrodipicolinate synthase
MLCGGQGNVSVTANVAPRQMHDLCVAAIAGKAHEAMVMQRKLLNLHKHMFTEANPIPVKWASARMGLCGSTMRLPMTPLSATHHAALEAAMRDCGLI